MNPADNPMVGAALFYARRFGFAVFPCQPHGKTPLTEHGFKDARKDLDIIDRWWQRCPSANVAIATGAASGIVVLDVDPRHGGDESRAALESAHGKLPDAPTVLTGGGGVHIYFRHPGHSVRNSAAALGPGLDIRGDGGYVIAPPSLHASGARYSWKSSQHITCTSTAAPPPWLIGVLQSTAAQQSAAPRRPSYATHDINFSQLAAGIDEGRRDDGLFKLACFLRRRGYTRQQATRVVLDAADRCRPPFPASQAERKVASAWRYL